MFDLIALEREFFDHLTKVDESILGRVAAGACPHCGGRLHRGDYPRKPRGGSIAPELEDLSRRFSLCCSREGCRKRATPPSVRFLGRRVYIGAVVVVACVRMLVLTTAAAARRATGIAPRTLRRWGRWWRDGFPATSIFQELRARLLRPPTATELPMSILAAMVGSPSERLVELGRWLAPLTTSSVRDGSRFVRAIA
jgi:hypothetical protein